MVMKGLLSVYYNRIFASPLMDFKQLCNVCITHQGSLPHRRRLSEVQARRWTFKPILTLFNRINININVLLNINIRMHIHIQDKVLNLRCILSITKVFEHMCKRVISNLWIQLHILILSRRIGTQICIASSIRRQDIVPMSVLDWSTRFKISLTTMSSQSQGLPVYPICIRIRCWTIKEHLLRTKSISSKYSKKVGC